MLRLPLSVALAFTAIALGGTILTAFLLRLYAGREPMRGVLRPEDLGGYTRRGLIFQGVAATLGLAAGALIGRPDKPGAIAEAPSTTRPAFAKISGGGLMPINHGMGAQVSGELW